MPMSSKGDRENDRGMSLSSKGNPVMMNKVNKILFINFRNLLQNKPTEAQAILPNGDVILKEAADIIPLEPPIEKPSQSSSPNVALNLLLKTCLVFLSMVILY